MTDLLVIRRASAAPKAEQCLECGSRLPATVGPEDELIEIDLELPAGRSYTFTVLGANNLTIEGRGLSNLTVEHREGLAHIRFQVDTPRCRLLVRA